VSDPPHRRPFFPGPADFAAAAAPHFRFLVDELGFSGPRVSGEPGDGFDVRFDGAHSAVLLNWESDGGYFACQLIPRAADGTLEPDYERWLSPIEILAARGALHEWPTQADFDDVDAAGFGALMDRAARCLREHCADVLAGDWSVYEAARRWFANRGAK
jgi:hypothetical protein